MAKNLFLYNEMGFYQMQRTDKDNKPSQTRIMFECFKTDKTFSVIKKDVDKARNHETNEMYVFNNQNQLVKKQEIFNNGGNTTKNKTSAYVYNNLGQLTEENFLSKDGTIRNYLHHQYNPQGDVLKSIYKDGEYILYDYKYDNQNNWIWKRKTSYEKSRYGNEMEIDERLTWDRTILYY